MFGKVIEEIREALATQSAFLNELGNRRSASDVEHRAIVAAIAAGSERAAAEAMRTHLQYVDSTLVDIVENKNARTDAP